MCLHLTCSHTDALFECIDRKQNSDLLVLDNAHEAHVSFWCAVIHWVPDQLTLDRSTAARLNASIAGLIQQSFINAAHNFAGHTPKTCSCLLLWA